MSWEDCGFKPGKIFGPSKCPKGACGDCDGEHHFHIGCRDGCLGDDEERPVLPEGLDPEIFFVCKHCEAFAEAVDEDEGDGAGCGGISGEQSGAGEEEGGR